MVLSDQRGLVAEPSQREIKRRFKFLGEQVISYLARMDVVMRTRNSPTRGRVIARLINQLELANDAAMRFGLNLERRGTKLRPLKRK